MDVCVGGWMDGPSSCATCLREFPSGQMDVVGIYRGWKERGRCTSRPVVPIFGYKGRSSWPVRTWRHVAASGPASPLGTGCQRVFEYDTPPYWLVHRYLGTYTYAGNRANTCILLRTTRSVRSNGHTWIERTYTFLHSCMQFLRTSTPMSFS